MRWQTTAILAVVLLALGAFYYVYEIRGGPERAKVEAQKGRLWTVDAADVTEVELRRGGEVVTLKREPDGWRLVGPVTARGDRGKVDETLTTLTTARVDREIESAPTRLEAYGLDKPAAVVTLRLKNGRQLGLQLGVKNPTGVWVYAREPDKPAVFGVPGTVLGCAARQRADLRGKAVTSLRPPARPRRSSSGVWTRRSRAPTPCGRASPRCCCCPPRRGRSCRRTSRCSGTRSSWRSTGTRWRAWTSKVRRARSRSRRSKTAGGSSRPRICRPTRSSLARSSSSSATSRPRRSSPMMRQASHGTSLGRPCA